MNIPEEIRKKINDEAEDAPCSYETAKYYMQKGYQFAALSQDKGQSAGVWVKASEKEPHPGRYFTVLKNQSRSISDFSERTGWRCVNGSPFNSEVIEWLDESQSGQSAEPSDAIDWKAKVEFYREQTDKIREFISVNKIGNPSQNIFEAMWEYLKSQSAEPVQDVEDKTFNYKDKLFELAIFDERNRFVNTITYFFPHESPNEFQGNIDCNKVRVAAEDILIMYDQLIERWQQSQPKEDAGENQDDEPYFGWCNVEGCENEGCSGGMAWRETGYWTVCYKHSADYREGKPQPKMKQAAIDKEASRGKDGCLPPNSIRVGKK